MCIIESTQRECASESKAWQHQPYMAASACINPCLLVFYFRGSRKGTPLPFQLSKLPRADMRRTKAAQSERNPSAHLRQRVRSSF